MNRERIRSALREQLSAIAPDADCSSLSPDANFREEFDLDSMDFLRWIRALHSTLGVEIPEADYRKLATFAGAEQYLAERLGVEKT